MKSPEANEQKAVIQWANASRGKYPCLAFLYACPNEGKHKVQYRVHQKAMGVRSGVPDLFLPYMKLYCGDDPVPGLYIEMKAKRGRVTENQREWIEYLRGQNYKVVVCWSAEEAIMQIKEYLNGG